MAMSQTPTYDQNFSKSRQVLPPIHEALLPMRHNYFSSSQIRDTVTSSPTVCQPKTVAMETKNFDASQNLYYPTTSYNTTGSSESEIYSKSQPPSVGLQTVTNSPYAVRESTINYSSATNNIVYSATTQCVTTTDCNNKISSPYSVTAAPITPAAPVTSGSTAILAAPSISVIPTAEPQQSANQQSYESSNVVSVPSCNVQTGQSQNGVSPTTITSPNTKPSGTIDQGTVKSDFRSPRQRIYITTSDANNTSFTSSKEVTGAQQIEITPTSIATGAVETVAQTSSQQFPTHRAVTKTYETYERKSRSKKEAEKSSTNVDEEVARNVTKILCASLKQKSFRNYSNGLADGVGGSQSSLLMNPCTSGNFTDCNATDSTPIGVLLGRKHVCNACNKAFTSLRNLQRHRSTCKSMFFNNNSVETKCTNIAATSATQQLHKIPATNEPGAASSALNQNCQSVSTVNIYVTDGTGNNGMKKEEEKILKSNNGMGPQCEDSFLDNAVAEMSRNNDFDLITNGSITPHLLDVSDGGLSPTPQREDIENADRTQYADSQSYSRTDALLIPVSEHLKITTPNIVEGVRLYKCEYCKKSVSSSRSLKRHQNTCKSYQNHLKTLKMENSSHSDIDKPSSSSSSVTTVPSTVENTPTLKNGTETVENGSSSITNASFSSSKITTASRRTSSTGLNVCEDCKKVLCSASNLKRHRSTCRAVLAKNEMNAANATKAQHAHSVPTTPTVHSFERTEDTELNANARNQPITTVTTTATKISPSLTSKSRRRFSSGGNFTYTLTNKNTVTVVSQQNITTGSLSSVTSAGLNLDVVATKPWITVGEHLKAQHTQRLNQQRQLEEQKRAEMQAKTAETKSQTCSVMNCVPVNQTYIYSIQPGATKQPNLILWSQGNVVNQNPVVTVMTTAADCNVVSIPTTVQTSMNCSDTVVSKNSYSKEVQQEKKYSFESGFGSGGNATISSDLGLSTDATVGEVINKKLALCNGILSSPNANAQSSTTAKQLEMSRPRKKEIRLLNSTITTVPIPSNRYPSSTHSVNDQTYSTGITYSQKNNSKSMLEMPQEPSDYRFECPECLKTYSCRKNVKRHRMAVHKLSADEVAKIEPVKVLVSNDDDYKRQRHFTVVKMDEQMIENYVTETVPKLEDNDSVTVTTAQPGTVVSQSSNDDVEMSLVYAQPGTQISGQAVQMSAVSSPATTMVEQCWQSATVPVTQSVQAQPTQYHFSADDNAQLAKIEEDLRRSAEFKLANINEADSESDVKKSVAELAEADTTTLSEDCEELNNHLPSHPGSVQCSGNLLSSPSPCNMNCPSYPVPDLNAAPCAAPSTSGGLASQLPPIRAPLPPVQQIIYQPNPTQPDPNPKARAYPTINMPVSHHQSLPKTRTHNTLPKAKQPHICADCNRTLSSDYSLKRHRSTCVEVKANAAAKAAAERLKDPNQLGQVLNGNQQLSYGVATSAGSSQLGINDFSTTSQSMRMSQHLSPLIDKNSEVVMPQPFTSFDEDVDTGVMCQICDCWLPGRREFDRHCEQRHPIVVDADSTTVVHSYDQSVTPPSAFLIHSPNSDIGSGSSASCSPAATRKRNRYSSPGHSSSPGSKTSKHLCLACGKYYSSEWNLERHKRESCPLKAKRSKVNEEKSPRLSKLETLELPPLRLNNTTWIADCYLLIGDTRVAVSKAVLSTSSTYFASLFQFYEGKNEVPLPEMVESSAFSLAMEVFNGQQNLDERSIDCVMYVADKFGIKTLYEKCESFVAEKLPASSVMHAIRLADEYNMLDLKNALFSSISIDVFRGLSADRDYCLMEPELKAELLEKWGTFL